MDQDFLVSSKLSRKTKNFFRIGQHEGELSENKTKNPIGPCC